MIKILKFLTVFAVIGVAVPATAHDPVLIEGQLSHHAGVEIDEDSDAYRDADALFERLEQADGQIIALDLRILPGGDDRGYSISRLDGAGADEDTEEGEGADGIGCEAGSAGFGDNLTAAVVVSTRHPAHFHAPIEIVVGSRMAFPLQHIACAYTGDPSAEGVLHIRGRFAVQIVSIPTALGYRLTPAN